MLQVGLYPRVSTNDQQALAMQNRALRDYRRTLGAVQLNWRRYHHPLEVDTSDEAALVGSENTAADASSSPIPSRPMGIILRKYSLVPSSDPLAPTSTMGVSVGPGLITFARMPRMASSAVQARTKETKAALLAEYAPRPSAGVSVQGPLSAAPVRSSLPSDLPDLETDGNYRSLYAVIPTSSASSSCPATIIESPGRDLENSITSLAPKCSCLRTTQ